MGFLPPWKCAHWTAGDPRVPPGPQAGKPAEEAAPYRPAFRPAPLSEEEEEGKEARAGEGQTGCRRERAEGRWAHGERKGEEEVQPVVEEKKGAGWGRGGGGGDRKGQSEPSG